MANLYELVDEAHDGESLAELGREFQLTPQQTEAAVTALLPAISAGLKQSTATFDGLGNLLAMMGQQPHLQSLYDDPEAALGAQGAAAGNDVLSTIFGSPAVTQGVIDHAQQFSGVNSGILKKLLPVLAGIVISGLMRSGSKPAAPQSPAPSGGGALGDILGQIFGRGMPGAPAGRSSPSPLPPPPQASPVPPPSSSPPSAPDETSGAGGPEGDLLGHVLRELEKGIREGRIKPVVIGGGPIQIPMPGGPMPSQPDAPQMPGQVPGGDIFGQILRDVFGGAIGSGGPLQMPQGRSASPPAKDLSDLSKQLGLMGGAGAALFGGRLDHGQDVDRSHLDNIQSVFDRFFTAQQ